jgi:hypothetical protein
MITANEVRKGIVDNLFDSLKKEGFKRVKNYFTNKGEDFSSTIFTSLVSGDHEYPTSFSFWVESKKVSQILKIAFQEPHGQNSSMVLVALTQSMVFKMKPKEFIINTEEDITIMCNKVMEYLETEGFRFFKEYQNYEKILFEMKSTPFGLFYGQGFVTWSLNALVISKMLEDKEYDQLVKKYIEYCEEYNLGDYLINKLKSLDGFLKDKTSQDLFNY